MKSGLLNVRDRNGDTGLHIACRRGFRDIVKELVKEGANRDILNLVSILIIMTTLYSKSLRLSRSEAEMVIIRTSMVKFMHNRAIGSSSDVYFELFY